MGLFSIIGNLFSSKSKEEKELEEIMRKVLKLLNDDEAQTQVMPAFLRSNYDTVPKDMRDGAYGEFGRVPSNPILCNGPIGEVTYLSKLLVDDGSDGKPVTFHRLTSAKKL